MPESGGEYCYLTRLYHPAVGFLSGWISLLVGFSAPIAASAIAFGTYLNAFLPGTVSPKIAALGLVSIVSLLHVADVRVGTYFQNAFTSLKILLIIILTVGGFTFGTGQMPHFFPSQQEISTIFSSVFAVSITFVFFAYSGWNAATYIGGEIKNPTRNLPLSLFIGTVIVVFLYLGLNVLYLYAIPMNDMAGKLEIGHLAAIRLFGNTAGRFFSLLIAFFLVSSVSAMIMAGPRVYQAMGKNIRFFSILTVTTKRHTPVFALTLQWLIAVWFILAMVFESLLYYIGFSISIFSWLTVFGVYIYRRHGISHPYKAWGYPVTPLIFLVATGWSILHMVSEKPFESLYAVLTLLIGVAVYLITQKRIVY
jgi:APA family basic amino acid/polyamine antiporter